VLVEPAVGVEEVVLLAPEHPREGLPHHAGRVLARYGGHDLAVELVGLRAPPLEDLLEARESVSGQRRVG
jgi:hypothetical protein